MFKPEKFIEKTIDQLKETIDDKAIIAFSGGVDSSVAAALVNKAVGDKLLAVHVDTGYMRKHESTDVVTLMRELGGTIAPDWIESGGELRDTIKSHHNVGGLPKDVKLKLVEPLRDLYKDEVRKIARFLGLKISERQPFPGPGLAIRVIGRATPERTEIVREACFIVEQEIERAVEQGKIELPWQYFAVLLPVSTVGVHGDVRVYGETIAVRAVQSVDAMTCSYSHIPHDVLDKISTRITNTLGDKVNRIVYDITNKPPGTVEWE